MTLDHILEGQVLIGILIYYIDSSRCDDQKANLEGTKMRTPRSMIHPFKLCTLFQGCEVCLHYSY